MTAIDYLIEQLQAPCRGIPNHIIEEAKRIDKERIKQLLEEYTNRIVENAKVCKDLGENEEGKLQFEITECYHDENGYPIYVEEESITSQLEIFKKEIGL